MSFIDTVILNLTERSCRTFQRLTGRTSVWLAIQLTNLSIILYFVWALMYSLIITPGSRLLLVAFCGLLLYALSQTLFKVPIESSEAAAYRRVATMIVIPAAPPRSSTMEMISIGPADLADAQRIDACTPDD